MTMTTATKPTITIERGLRQYVRTNGNNARVVLRIDWRTGSIDIYGRHYTECTSWTQAESDNKIRCWYMDNRLTNKALLELAESLTDLVAEVQAGYIELLNPWNTRPRGHFDSNAQDAVYAITHMIDQLNLKKALGEI